MLVSGLARLRRSSCPRASTQRGGPAHLVMHNYPNHIARLFYLVQELLPEGFPGEEGEGGGRRKAGLLAQLTALVRAAAGQLCSGCCGCRGNLRHQ